MGEAHPARSPAALVERWNGHGWRAQPTPVPAGSDSVGLSGVSCSSASDCTAVGDFGTARGAQHTLAEHFNGQSWSIEPTPAQPGTLPSLGAVSCSGQDCMALGRVFTTSGVAPLAEQFNGATWSVVPLAIPGGASGFELSGIDCTAPSNCYAAGASGGTGGAAATLIEHWDGQAWAVVPSPNAAGASVLTGVSCSAGGACMAVGRFSAGTSVSTLAMKRSAGHWTITPTPSPS